MFAQLSDGATWALFIVGVIVLGGGNAIYQFYLLTRHPEAWRAMKAAEQEAKDRKRKALGGAAMTGINIARLFLKK
jgi:hypothetical protein